MVLLLLAGAAIPLRVMPAGPRFRRLARAVLVLAIAWFPLGVFLSGNLGLNFTDSSVLASAYRTFTWFVAGTILLMVAVTGFLNFRSAIELAEFDE